MSFDTSWTTLQRGDEADPIAVIERVLKVDSFNYAGQDGPVSEYTFDTKLPTLNPMMDKKFLGRINISQGPRSSDFPVPIEVNVTSTDKTVSWLVRFSDFDQVPPITFPFARQWRIKLLAASPDSAFRIPHSALPRPSIAASDPPLLRGRLVALGFDSRSEPAGDTLVLYLEREIHPDLLAGLIQPGHAEIWLARRPLFKGPLPPGARRLPLYGDTLQKLIAEKPVLTRQDISGTTVIDSLGSPVPGPGSLTLRILLTKAGAGKAAQHNSLNETGILWALVMDDDIVALAKVTKRARTDQLDLTGPDNPSSAAQIKVVLDSPVLAHRWTLVARERIAP